MYGAPPEWPRRLASRFVPLGPDPAAEAFLRSVPRASVARTLAHHALCGLPLDDFDVNAWLGIVYPLHLLTNAQLRALFAAAALPTPLSRALDDVGAGEGSVTAELRPLCARLVAAETSRGMAARLRRAGLEVWEEDLAESAAARVRAGHGGFSLVALLNVLDRCSRPRGLLSAAHCLLGPSPSWLLLATPLPFRPAYFGPDTRWSGRPVEPFLEAPAPGAPEASWASEAEQILDGALPRAGFEPRAISRVPYLCGGDAFAPASELDALVVLAERAIRSGGNAEDA
ncbi:unnamed protein product [Prorocentrum cordatum]|uniref:Small RNA 2'-O-methyltransferase n=1 Tax=Prorocentrum cordatum TaxID=2364126 RepID=A0ABN9SYL6_9DINO|nr:unnamed protein product [Polarella glacialis]